MYSLVVRNPFGGYAKGAVITDPATVAAILADHHKASCVVKAAAPSPAVLASVPLVSHPVTTVTPAMEKTDALS